MYILMFDSEEHIISSTSTQLQVRLDAALEIYRFSFYGFKQLVTYKPVGQYTLYIIIIA